jgi:hypothetical protein
MSLALATGDTITGVAGSATSITYTISGDEIAAGADAFKVLAQGQLPSSVGTLYTVPASTEAIVKTIHLANMTGGTVTARLNVKGTADANAILPPISILAGGFAVYAADGWHVYNDQGQLLSVGATGADGADGAPGPPGANTIITKDEGGTLYAAVTTLDFVGDGVTASGAGATTTVTIPDAKGLPLGLTGAVAATRYVGGTASIAPTTGTFAIGDFVITQAGSIYICVGAGSPGTWTQVSGGAGGASDFARTFLLMGG